jgi:hypothetical protein
VLLPGYDLLTRRLGMRDNYDRLVAKAELGDARALGIRATSSPRERAHLYEM